MYGDGGFNVNQTTISEHGAVEGLNANMLKVAVGLSALIFIIMLQAHHNHDPDSPHSGYITGVCHNIAVEVFDSVTLISLLIVQDKNYSYLKIWNFNQLIVFLSSFNLILPTITMYSLSLSDFGRHLDRVIHIKVLTQLLQLFVVNIPFFGVRIYLWAHLNYDLSLFVVKNLCYIFMLMHSLYPGMVYVLTGKPCGHLVVYPGARMNEPPHNGASETNEKENRKNLNGNDSGSSNEIEMLPMQRNSQRNLNRVSQPPPQACESGDEGSP